MTEIIVSQVIERMQKVLGINSEAALGRELAIAPQTISSWKKNNSIPYSYCKDIAISHNISINWLLTGDGIPYNKPINNELLAECLDLVSKHMSFSDSNFSKAVSYVYEKNCFQDKPDKQTIAGIAQVASDLLKTNDTNESNISLKDSKNSNVIINSKISGDVSLNVKKTTRPKIEVDERHISNEGALQIRQLVKDLVDREVSAGKNEKNSYAKWYQIIRKRFRVVSYREIPAELETNAISWLKQQKALKRSHIRRNDNKKWRSELIGAIKARYRNQLDMSDARFYAFANKKLNTQINSLTELGERKLKVLYNIVMKIKY